MIENRIKKKYKHLDGIFKKKCLLNRFLSHFPRLSVDCDLIHVASRRITRRRSCHEISTRRDSEVT
jgi:hypothetical protein